MNCTIMETELMSQRIRNKMSAAALIMAFMFGWVMFLAAHIIDGCHEARAAATVDINK